MGAEIPHILRDGQTLWMDSEFIHKLHHGAPEVGWVGDERLGVYYGDNCMELRRADDSGNMRLICRSRPGLRHLGTETLIFLAEHDPQSRRAYNVIDDINTHNARIQASRDAKNADRSEAAADRLAHGLLKDVGAYEGGITRRLYPGVDVPKKG